MAAAHPRVAGPEVAQGHQVAPAAVPGPRLVISHLGEHRGRRLLGPGPEAAAPSAEAAPRGQGLAGAEPGAGDDARYEPHEQAEDEHLYLGPGRGLRPPALPLGDLVHEAARHTGLGEAVEDEEHGDAGHEPPGAGPGAHQARHQPGEEEDEGGGQAH